MYRYLYQDHGPYENIYEGSIKNGTKHGYGTYTNNTSGIIINGYWIDNVLQSNGSILLPNGDHYTGDNPYINPYTNPYSYTLTLTLIR